MATYEQQMKNIRDSQQQALAALFADISADDAQLKSIYEKWNAQGLTQQFGFSMSGTQQSQSSDSTVDCKSGVCRAPSTTVPQMAKWDATNGTWDFGTTGQSTREVSARRRTYPRSHRRDRDSSDSESESDWSGSDSDSGWSGSDSESDPYDSESVESGSESESESE